jgi:hypothetical protein
VAGAADHDGRLRPGGRLGGGAYPLSGGSISGWGTGALPIR